MLPDELYFGTLSLICKLGLFPIIIELDLRWGVLYYCLGINEELDSLSPELIDKLMSFCEILACLKLIPLKSWFLILPNAGLGELGVLISCVLVL
jgi:hypothetical protein